jgi:hypothetical protein
MSNDEVMTLLDTLLEVERAGAKALAIEIGKSGCDAPLAGAKAGSPERSARRCR